MAGRTFRKKTQRQSRVLFDVIFDVYTHVDNRERARASECKLGECVRWGGGGGGLVGRGGRGGRWVGGEGGEGGRWVGGEGGEVGWWVVSASGKRVQILMGL